MLTVCAAQFATGDNVEENLATCLRMIDAAAARGVQLLVLPEFCNHLSWYRDSACARAVALTLDGAFLTAIAERAAQHRLHLVINVSLKGPVELTVTSLLYGPDGQCLHRADKQTLMGHENTWFARAAAPAAAVDTEIARLGLFPCRDGVTFETPRALALQGAQIFCDSLNSFALDEAALHVPARAAENRVFMVAANKVGPLIPEALLGEVSAATAIPEQFLYGAGESQIVAPDGTVLARGPRSGEALVIAEIDPAQADNKRRRDGSDLLAARRPALYGGLGVARPQAIRDEVPESVVVACLAPTENALLDDPAWLRELPQDTVLGVFPELFGCSAAALAELDELPAGGNSKTILDESRQVLAYMQALCCKQPGLHLVNSLPLSLLEGEEGLALTTVLVNESGVIARQALLHPSRAHPWSVTGDQLELVDLPWARLALVAGDDLHFPELVKLAALRGAHVLAVPFTSRDAELSQYGLPSRSAENRLCVVASARAGTGHGLIASLHGEFTLMTPWSTRVFDGMINLPLITGQREQVTAAPINPRAATNKLMSADTDLLADRPWFLSAALWQ